jgi:hypothetical protein
MCSAALACLTAPPVFAVNVAQNLIVSANPMDNTPDVVSTGDVRAFVQSGSTMFAGGQFSQVRNHSGGTTYTRNNLFAFDVNTGAVNTSFTASTDGLVHDLILAPDGIGVLVGGEFHQVNGVARVALAEVNRTNGATVATFRPPLLDGRIFSMRLAGGKLYIGGSFKHVNGLAIPYLARLNPTTGAVDTAFHADFTGLNNPANPGFNVVYKLDISPNGQRLVAIGNFMQVNGADRPQIALFDVTGAAATLVNWETNRFRQPCSEAFQTYMRDVDFAPDGGYFVVVTSGGGYNGDQSVGCDSATRWETGATGSGLQPTWVDFTGNDTMSAVAVTGTVVYTGGHNRWVNNPYGNDDAGPGAIYRPGLSALDPVTGVPFDWNPTRAPGVGVFDMVSTSTGLWVGHDTDYVGHEYHHKLAFFPLTGGKPVPAVTTGSLPGDVYRLSSGTPSSESIGTCGSIGTPTSADTVARRHVDPAAHPVASPDVAVAPQGRAWSQIRAAVMLSNTVYTAWRNGNFCAQSFNGTTFGAATKINLYNNTFGEEIPSLGGMFFVGNRMYYTRDDQNGLFYRYFVPESAIFGATSFQASDNLVDLNFSKVADMMLSGNKLYYVTRTDGLLRQINWNGKAPVAGTAIPLSGPTIDGEPWNSPGLFLHA